jgi:hypothetical protein
MVWGNYNQLNFKKKKKKRINQGFKLVLTLNTLGYYQGYPFWNLPTIFSEWRTIHLKSLFIYWYPIKVLMNSMVMVFTNEK